MPRSCSRSAQPRLAGAQSGRGGRLSHRARRGRLLRGSTGRYASGARPSIGTWVSQRPRSSRSTRAAKHRGRPRFARNDALGAAPVALTALEHVALARELAVDGEGTAGELRALAGRAACGGGRAARDAAAPSGAMAAVSVPRSDGESPSRRFGCRPSQGSPLAQLADEGVRGVWRLTVVDRAKPATPACSAAGAFRSATTSRATIRRSPSPIPDPTRTRRGRRAGRGGSSRRLARFAGCRRHGRALESRDGAARARSHVACRAAPRRARSRRARACSPRRSGS